MIKETRYSASTSYSFRKVIRDIFSDIPSSISLGYQLAKRNLKAKYRKSFLGIIWAVVPPIATASIWIFLQGQGLFRFQNLEIPYPVFVICGIFLWQIFVQSFSITIQTVLANKGILVKINFPREALFFAAVFELLFNLLLNLIIIGCALAFFGVVPDAGIFCFFPYMIGLIFLGLSIGLFVLPFSLLFSDVQHFMPLVFQFAMYLTPVIYPQPILTGAFSVLEYNPVTPLLVGARSALTGEGTGISMSILSFIFVLGILVFFGLIIMRITMRILIERMGS